MCSLVVIDAARTSIAAALSRLESVREFAAIRKLSVVAVAGRIEWIAGLGTPYGISPVPALGRENLWKIWPERSALRFARFHRTSPLNIAWRKAGGLWR
jgi:hypothetical protein